MKRNKIKRINLKKVLMILDSDINLISFKKDLKEKGYKKFLSFLFGEVTKTNLINISEGGVETMLDKICEFDKRKWKKKNINVPIWKKN